MNIQDAVRDALADVVGDDTPPRDGASRAIAIARRRHRHRRTRLVAAGAAAGIAAGVTAVAVVDDGREPTVRVGPPTASRPSSGAEPGIHRLDADGIPAVLFATNGNAGGVAVTDLDAGERTEYGPGEHTAPPVLTNAALTARDELIVWSTDTPALAYAARGTGGRNPLVHGGLAGPARELRSTLGERTLLPTDSGAHVWSLVASSEARRLELVDVETGEVVHTTTVAPGSRLVDAIGESAVIAPNAHGVANEVLVVSAAGARSVLPAPEPAVFVAATDRHAVWIASEGAAIAGSRLLVVARDGSSETVVAPEGDLWTPTGGPTIPSNGPGFRIETSDGSRVLLGLARADDRNRESTRHAVVDLDRGATTVVERGPGSAFWAGDDRTVVVVAGGDRQVVTSIDSVTGRVTTVEDAVAPGYFVIAAR
jgi:hypothetical protein